MMVNLGLNNAANTCSVVKTKCGKVTMVSITSFIVHCYVRYNLQQWINIVKWRKPHLPAIKWKHKNQHGADKA